MKKYTSFILIIALSLWAVCSGFSTANAGENITPTDLPPAGVEQPFETPTDLVSFGDITEDRVINAKDALWVLKAAVCKCIIPLHQELIADVTRDGRIDAKDALEMLKYAVGKPNAIQPMEIKLQTIWPDSYTANTPYATAWKTQLATADISYGIKTNIEGIDPYTAVDTFAKGVLAGKVETDLIEVTLYTARMIAKQKVAANLYQSKTLNKSLFRNGGTGGMTFDDRCYGVSLLANSSVPAGILYNKDLLKRYAPDVDIQDLYAKKDWTFDALRALANRCTVDVDEDGKIDLYGITSNNNIMGMAASSNTGGSAVMKNGRIEDVLFTQEGVDAMLWCKDLYKTDKSWRYRADLRTAIQEFAEEKAVMFAAYGYMSQRVAETADFEMGFVPMAIGPSQTDYVNNSFDAAVYMVPKTNERRLNEVGIWLNGIADVSDALMKVRMEQLVESGVDAQGCKNYEKILRSATPDYSTGVYGSGSIGSYVENMPSFTPERLVVVHQSVQQELDDFYASFYE